MRLIHTSFVTGLILGTLGAGAAVLCGLMLAVDMKLGALAMAGFVLFAVGATWRELRAIAREPEVPLFVTSPRVPGYGDWFGDTDPGRPCGMALAAGVQEEAAARREDDALRRVFMCSACSGTGVRHAESDPEVCFRCDGSGVALFES